MMFDKILVLAMLLASCALAHLPVTYKADGSVWYGAQPANIGDMNGNMSNPLTGNGSCDNGYVPYFIDHIGNSFSGYTYYPYNVVNGQRLDSGAACLTQEQCANSIYTSNLDIRYIGSDGDFYDTLFNSLTTNTITMRWAGTSWDNVPQQVKDLANISEKIPTPHTGESYPSAFFGRFSAVSWVTDINGNFVSSSQGLQSFGEKSYLNDFSDYLNVKWVRIAEWVDDGTISSDESFVQEFSTNGLTYNMDQYSPNVCVPDDLMTLEDNIGQQIAYYANNPPANQLVCAANIDYSAEDKQTCRNNAIIDSFRPYGFGQNVLKYNGQSGTIIFSGTYGGSPNDPHIDVNGFKDSFVHRSQDITFRWAEPTAFSAEEQQLVNRLVSTYSGNYVYFNPFEGKYSFDDLFTGARTSIGAREEMKISMDFDFNDSNFTLQRQDSKLVFQLDLEYAQGLTPRQGTDRMDFLNSSGDVVYSFKWQPTAEMKNNQGFTSKPVTSTYYEEDGVVHLFLIYDIQGFTGVYHDPVIFGLKSEKLNGVEGAGLGSILMIVALGVMALVIILLLIVRIDMRGRVVLPGDLRDNANLKKGDYVDLQVKGKIISIKKEVPDDNKIRPLSKNTFEKL